jgi:hypothetical protein
MARKCHRAEHFQVREDEKVLHRERNVQELIIEDKYIQIAKLICQLVEVRSSKDHKKSDHISMNNFENPFQKHA